MTDSQIERVGCLAWGPMVTGFPFAVFLRLMSEALQLVLGVSACRSSSLHPLSCNFGELAHRSATFRRDGFLPFPH